MLSKSYAYRNPALVSALEGSNWAVNATLAGEPSLTGPTFGMNAVGGTLVTATVLMEAVVTPPSPSLTWTPTV